MSAAASGGDGKVRAAMNGRVVAVLVKPGEQVAAGQPVMTLEAMKMEHVHTAGVAGTVSAIDVAEGEQVTTGKIVVEIEAAASRVVPDQRERPERRPGPIVASSGYRASSVARRTCATRCLWYAVPAFARDDARVTPLRPVPSLSQHAT